MKRYMMQAQKAQAYAAKAGESSLQMGINLQGLQKQQELNAMEGAQAFGLADPTPARSWPTQWRSGRRSAPRPTGA